MKLELPASVRDYLSEAVYELTSSGITVTLHPEALIQDMRGWYDSENREMHVCMDAPLHIWLPTFVHEFQHYRQHRAATGAWSFACDANWLGEEFREGNCDWVFENLYVRKSRKKMFTALTEVQRHEVTRRVMEVERECEERAAEELERYRLPVDLDFFRRDAFRNIAAYAVAYYCGEWRHFDMGRLGDLPTDLGLDFFDWACKTQNQRLWKRAVRPGKVRNSPVRPATEAGSQALQQEASADLPSGVAVQAPRGSQD